MGAPVGNVNAVRNKPWADALRRAVARRVEANDKPGLNRLSEPDLVRQDDAARQRIAAGEQCRIDLVWVEINL